MKITIFQENRNSVLDQELKEYESTTIIPQIGDRYAGICFEDGHGRTVVSRLIFPDAPNYINVYVKYTYPELVLNETESNLLTQNELS